MIDAINQKRRYVAAVLTKLFSNILRRSRVKFPKRIFHLLGTIMVKRNMTWHSSEISAPPMHTVNANVKFCFLQDFCMEALSCNVCLFVSTFWMCCRYVLCRSKSIKFVCIWPNRFLLPCIFVCFWQIIDNDKVTRSMRNQTEHQFNAWDFHIVIA